jgi:hypothetical protein
MRQRRKHIGVSIAVFAIIAITAEFSVLKLQS